MNRKKVDELLERAQRSVRAGRDTQGVIARRAHLEEASEKLQLARQELRS